MSLRQPRAPTVPDNGRAELGYRGVPPFLSCDLESMLQCGLLLEPQPSLKGTELRSLLHTLNAVLRGAGTLSGFRYTPNGGRN